MMNQTVGGKPKKPYRSNKHKDGHRRPDKGRDPSSHPGGHNKDCAFLSPCFNEVTTGDGKGGVNAQSRLEVVDLLIDWHSRVLREVDHRKLTKLLNTPGRRCLTKDLTDVLSTLRGKLEEVEKKLLPQLTEKHMHYESLLLAAKQQQGANKFTDAGQNPVALDGDETTFREMLRDGRLRYATFPMNRILPSLNAALSTRLKMYLQDDDDTDDARPSCDQPTMVSLSYSPKADLFYAEYRCEDSELQYNLRFKVRGLMPDPDSKVDVLERDPSEDADDLIKFGDVDAYGVEDGADDWFSRMARGDEDGSRTSTSVMGGGRGRKSSRGGSRNGESGPRLRLRPPHPSSPPPSKARPAAASPPPPKTPGPKAKAKGVAKGAETAAPKASAPKASAPKPPPRACVKKSSRG